MHIIKKIDFIGLKLVGAAFRTKLYLTAFEFGGWLLTDLGIKLRQRD